jgi:cell division protease FtsH
MNGNLIRTRRNPGGGKPQKTENFEVVTKSDISFKDIGGYDNIKLELTQCVDILKNYKKYSDYNVRIPKGLILEGPPGNGKTLLAKGFADEAETAFIPVSGSQFQDKYVGVGSTRVRELFELAKKNTPCIVFIDEIDAIGRKRSGDGESSSNERDSTLNELLVSLDGFKTSTGVFLMGATNRADLLDPALIRPGRIDKRIFIGPPDSKTREAILNIHLKGKPHDKSINVKDLVDMTAGLSGAQIENILNEAMLNALRHNRALMEYRDIDSIISKMMVGWQPTEHQFTNDIIERIAIHEMGHAIVGFLSKHHSKVSKVIINLSSPNSPGYTMFESSTSNIYTREALFEHLMILLAGRIAEEVFYDVSVTTGAINDFQEAFKLAEKMIIYYGMGKSLIYPNLSDKYKEKIDSEVIGLINDAYAMAQIIVKKSKNLIYECADILTKEKLLKIDRLTEIINEKYPEIYTFKIEN